MVEVKEKLSKAASATLKTQTNKVVYILTGAPASGKSWVTSRVAFTFDALDSDSIPKKELVKRVDSVAKPLLALTVGVSTFMKNNPQWDYKLVVIIEPEEVINKRMIERGGVITNTIKRRMRRMTSLAKQAVFSGTSQEVLDFIISAG